MTGREAGDRRFRVLITGAGGPAAIAAMKSLRADPTLKVLAADMDPWAAGLYLVPPDARTLVPPGAAPGFADAMLDICATLGVDILLPTVDAELEPLAAARAAFAAAGTDLLLAPAAALEVILDKLTLARHCKGIVAVPRTEPFGLAFDPRSWTFPVVVKPRRGSGSRGFALVADAEALAAMDRSGALIVQEYLPGVPGTLGLTIASGVDMPRLAVDSLLARPVPTHVDFREIAVVRFLDERFLELADMVGHPDAVPGCPTSSGPWRRTDRCPACGCWQAWKPRCSTRPGALTSRRISTVPTASTWC